MPHLFEPFRIRDVILSHRIVVSPMCQYSSIDGFANDWHFIHLGSRAVGGAALVFTEATAVTPEGRISPHDLGIWRDDHQEMLTRIVGFIHEQRTVAGMQLAHAGRKGSTVRPWEGQGGVSAGGWQPVGPTDEPFAPGYPKPRALSAAGIRSIVAAFGAAARRALACGFDLVEIHAAHGYLIHEFLSPLSNTRTDEYGGSFDHRVRLALEIVDEVRRVWPEKRPLFARISATDWVDGGWDIEQSVELARRLHHHGVDVIDCSSGGNVPLANVPMAAGYQVGFAERIRREAGVATGAVGLITDASQANAIIEHGQADCILLAREMLRDPYWPFHAAAALGHQIAWPAQYLRAAPPATPARAART